MKMVRGLICGVFGVLVVMAVAYGFGGPEKASRRNLTATEMAGLYGRQAQPLPDCKGCYNQIAKINCDFTDPCKCSTVPENQQNGPCPEVSDKSENFGAINTQRVPTAEELQNPNDKWIDIQNVVCSTPAPCMQDTVAEETQCDAKTGMCGEPKSAASSCQRCKRLFPPLTPYKVTNYKCENCPSKKNSE